MRHMWGLAATLAVIAASSGVSVAQASYPPDPLTTPFLAVTVSIPNGTLDGPDCTAMPFTITFSKIGNPLQVAGTVELVYAQQESNAFSTASVRIETDDPAKGGKSGELEVCTDKMPSEANLMEVSATLHATSALQTASATTTTSFFVGRASTTVIGFRAEGDTVRGTVQAQTQRFGAVGATGKAVVWFRPPGKRLFTRLGTSTLDQLGRFRVPTKGRVPKRALLKVNTSGCSWCKEAYAETRMRQPAAKPTKPRKPRCSFTYDQSGTPQWSTSCSTVISPGRFGPLRMGKTAVSQALGQNYLARNRYCGSRLEGLAARNNWRRQDGKVSVWTAGSRMPGPIVTSKGLSSRDSLSKAQRLYPGMTWTGSMEVPYAPDAGWEIYSVRDKRGWLDFYVHDVSRRANFFAVRASSMPRPVTSWDLDGC